MKKLWLALEAALATGDEQTSELAFGQLGEIFRNRGWLEQFLSTVSTLVPYSWTVVHCDTRIKISSYGILVYSSRKSNSQKPVVQPIHATAGYGCHGLGRGLGVMSSSGYGCSLAL